MSTDNEHYDMVVIGCGAAGLSSALSAAEAYSEAGREPSIAVLERAPYEERGGNTRWTSSYMRLKDAGTIADNFVEDMLAFSDGRSNERYLRKLAEKAPETMAWVQDKGVGFDYLPTIFLTLNQPRLLPVGGGAAIVETLAGQVEHLGIPIMYETTAERLVVDDEGEIAGVEVIGADGERRVLHTEAVIVASGGFEGSTEMMARYMGDKAYNLPTIASGSQFNKGEGIEMSLAVGAEPSGQWDAFHAEPIDARSTKEEGVVMTFPYGVLVNKSGKRFLDEGESSVDEIYEKVARTIFYEQEDQIAYLIIDQKMFDIPNYQHAVLTDQEPYTADSISGLAEQIGLDPEAVSRSIAEYNGAATGDESKFDALNPDGLAASGDLEPPKSNWARKINQPPYLAYPICCSIVFTFGGISTNEQAEVLDTGGDPIPGLYAAGETTGIYYGKYPGATSVIRCLTFGKIAGERAAGRAREKEAIPGGRS